MSTKRPKAELSAHFLRELRVLEGKDYVQYKARTKELALPDNYKEAASGAHERQVFDNLCKSLQAGDTLVVCKMDRFCRSAKEGLQYVDLLRDKGVAVHILNMGLLDNSPMGRLVATMLLAFAEFERAQIIERTQSGRQAAMAKPGFRDGRPLKFTALQLEHALGLLSEYSYKQVEAMTGISRSTLQRAKKKVEVEQ